MAYRAEIEIVAKGITKVAELQKNLNQLSTQIDHLNGPGSLKDFNGQLARSIKLLDRVQQGTVEEKRAVEQYVTALKNANSAQLRTNSLIAEEITRRDGATASLKRYNAAAAGPRQPGSMTAQYLRPGSTAPQGPDTAADFMQRTDAAAKAALRQASAFTVARNEAKKFAKAQLEINNAAFLQRTDAAAAAAKRQTAEYLAQARAAKVLANEQKRLMDALPKGVPTTAHKRPIGPQPKGAKSGANSALQTAGEFGLGTGFPLLFGGGAGQVIGGGLGTALAGAFGLAGQAAMGLQIGLSAVIGKAEELITRFKDVGNAINSLSMDALASSFITVNEETRTLVRRLIEAGQAEAAVSVAANEVYKQTRLAPDAVSDITNNLNVLSNVWDEVVAAVAGLVSLVTKDLITGLSIVLKLVSLIAKGMNVVIQKTQEISETKFFKTLLGTVPVIGGPLVAYGTAMEKIQENTKGISEEEQKALALAKEKVDQVQTEVIRSKELYDIEKTRTKGKTAAEQSINAKIEKARDLKELQFETEDKILAIRKEHVGVEDSVLQKLIDGEKALAKIKELRINDAFAIKEQNIDLLAQKEILKEKTEQHKLAQGAIQAQTVALEGQIQIFNLQAQAAQSVFAVTQARNKSELSALKLEESRLQRQLARLQKIDGFYTTQGQLINKIAANRKRQAEIEFKVTQQSIKQMVAKAELERQAVRLQVQKIDLQIELLRLQAEEIEDTQKKLESLARINQQAKISVEIAKQMTISADKSLASAREIAKYQLQSAEYLRDGKLESIEAERVDARRAVHAAAIARSAKAASSATSSGSSSGSGSAGSVSDAVNKATTLGPAGRTTQTMSTAGPISDEVKKQVLSRAPVGGYRNPADLVDALNKGMGYYGNGGHVSGAQIAMIGEKGPEYVVPEKKAAAFATNYLMGARGAGAIPRYAEGGYTGSINIQTGPVMQQDNQTYLTIGQFEEGMRELTESLARGGRSYGSRQFQGISS